VKYRFGECDLGWEDEVGINSLTKATQASKVGTDAIMTQFYWSITDGVLKAVGCTILGFASNRYVCA
jgi:hypothetical protein